MDIKNRFITKALAGIVLGILVGVMFWVLTGSLENNNDNMALLIHLGVSGLLGLICNGSSIVYEIESWGTLLATVSHYLLCMLTFILISSLMNWFPNRIGFIIMLVIMTVIYAGIWVGEMLYWKKTIKQVNEQLKNIRK
jgi:hypothetical protein